MALCSLNILPKRVNHNTRKYKTWRFASEFLIRKNVTKDQAELGRWTKDRLIELGPTFVKLGQIASTRADLYSPEFIQQLEALQDDVPPCEIDIDVKHDIFKEFDPVPFKSASIGQVHMAVLQNGQKVVVKVKRPGILSLMKEDTDTIRGIVHFLERVGIDTGNSSGQVLDESIEYLLGEADYKQEINNAIKFRKSMKDVDWVKVPKVYKKYSDDETIVMEYVPSVKLTEITDKKVNKKKICEALINAYVIQTMDNGLFHADPHPGNLGFSPKGQLVFYDFGLLVPLSEELRDGFTKLFGFIITRDTAGIVDTLVKLGVIVPTSSDVSDIELFFETILGYLETLDGSGIVNDDLAAQLAIEKPFVVPSSFVYLAKAFSTIEGICIKLDPDFNYFTYLEPLIQQQIIESVDVGDIFMKTTEIPGTIGKINTAVSGLQKSRGSMKRTMIKTRQEIKFVQYSVVCALLAEKFGDSPPLAMFFVLCTLWFTFRKNQ
jgi:predicted unusual protein kinase regulating ubiquinone biosynthesis (AarF/ABC1/UbiB family)